MECFPVRYDSRVVIYDHRAFIRLATGLQFNKTGSDQRKKNVAFSYAVESKLVKLETSCTVILFPMVSVVNLIKHFTPVNYDSRVII